MTVTFEVITGLVVGFELLEAEREDDDNIVAVHLGFFRVMFFY